MEAPAQAETRAAFKEHGYAIVRNAIDRALAAEMVAHVQWLAERHPDIRPEALHHNLLANDPFIHRLVGDERLLDIAGQFVGDDIALFAAHYIAKKPFTGQAVAWHQDGSYWPLEPMEVITLWVAGTDSTVETGCMRVIPGTQNHRLLKPREMIEVDTEDHVLPLAIRREDIDESNAVDIELRAGDVSIHNPQIIHGSNANHSNKWRVGLTLRYIPTSTHVLNDQHENILLRGEAAAGIDNVYAPRPVFIEGEHMAFDGCETWGP